MFIIANNSEHPPKFGAFVDKYAESVTVTVALFTLVGYGNKHGIITLAVFLPHPTNTNMTNKERAKRLEKLKSRLASEAARYDFPNPLVGAVITLSYIGDESKMIQGTVTSMEYGDDGIPILQISSSTFGGDKILCVYPAGSTGSGEWTIKVRKDSGNDSFYPCLALFSRGD